MGIGALLNGGANENKGDQVWVTFATETATLIPPVTYAPVFTSTSTARPPTATRVAPTFTPVAPPPALPNTGSGPTQTIVTYFEALGLTAFATCTWRNEGGYDDGYVVSPTNDYSGWQLHVHRWDGDNGLGDVFLAEGYTFADFSNFDLVTAWVAEYVSENGFGAWNGARGC